MENTEKKQKRRKKKERGRRSVGRVVKNGGEECVFRGRARLGGAGGPLIFARCISRVLSGEREDRCECDLLLSRPVKLNYYDRYR